MEVEYSSKKREGFAYTFQDWEKRMIAESLRIQIKKRETKIQKLINHPKNEGQVTYLCQIDDLRKEIVSIKEIIKEFES